MLIKFFELLLGVLELLEQFFIQHECFLLIVGLLSIYSTVISFQLIEKVVHSLLEQEKVEAGGLDLLVLLLHKEHVAGLEGLSWSRSTRTLLRKVTGLLHILNVTLAKFVSAATIMLTVVDFVLFTLGGSLGRPTACISMTSSSKYQILRPQHVGLGARCRLTERSRGVFSNRDLTTTNIANVVGTLAPSRLIRLLVPAALLLRQGVVYQHRLLIIQDARRA